MQKELEQKIKIVLEELQKTEVLSLFTVEKVLVERPKDEQFGEYTSNVALMYAKEAKMNPLELAALIVEKLPKEDFEKIEVVKPGYINFSLSSGFLQGMVATVLQEKEKYGDASSQKEGKINNEFISANPTGPLHLGNARGGFYSDVLSRVLRKRGCTVTNEYYVNDAGEQVLKLGHSVLKDEEAVYGGEYIDTLAEQFAGLGDVEAVGRASAEFVLDHLIKGTIERMGVSFDVFVSERKDIVEKGYVEKAIALLKEKDLTYESEGALWLKTTLYGDDKDRVLIKSDGSKTYFASDCGYLLFKQERGFTELIETWGADHHGYITRFKAAAQGLGYTTEPRFIIVQLVKLVKDGEEVRMSKRAGNVVTIDELLERVGPDVARFFFLMYAPETQMNFDLGLAEERSQKNPVFYVQYAHARLCSILRKAEEEGLGEEKGDLSLLIHRKERELMRELMYFPASLEAMAVDFGVHRLPQLALRLADKLHSYYDECRVLDGENKELTLARLQLIRAVRIVLGQILSLAGVSAPEKM